MMWIAPGQKKTILVQHSSQELEQIYNVYITNTWSLNKIVASLDIFKCIFS